MQKSLVATAKLVTTAHSVLGLKTVFISIGNFGIKYMFCIICKCMLLSAWSYKEVHVKSHDLLI